MNEKLNRVKTISRRKLLFAGVIASLAILISSVTIAGVCVTDSRALFSGIDHEDIGGSIFLDFSNVTYTTDGTGTDVLAKVIGTGASINEISSSIEIQSRPLKLQSLIAQGIYIDPSEIPYMNPSFSMLMSAGPSIRNSNGYVSYETLKSLWGKSAGTGSSLQTETNETTDDELFQFAQDDIYSTGSHDFRTDYDADTVWLDSNVSAGANLFNVSSQYIELNETLTEADGLGYDEVFTNVNTGGNYILGASAETYVVGYLDTEEGIIEDLRAYLGFIEGVSDLDDIVILEYNLSQAQIAYNISETFYNEIQDLVDWAGEQSVNWQASTSMIQSASAFDLLGSVTGFLGNAMEGIRHCAVSFGTNLEQFGEKLIEIPSNILGSLSSTAETAMQTAGGVIKSGLEQVGPTVSGFKELVVDVTDTVGAGVGQITNLPMTMTTSLATTATNILTSPIGMIFAVVVVVAVVIAGAWLIKTKTDIL